MMKYAMHQSGLLAPESQVQTAPQRQDNALLMLLAGGVALFLILKRSQEAGATPPSGETPGVPVVPSGGIAEVAVSGTKGAIMGSHAVEKIPGTMIAWNVAWNAGSTTATGLPVSWLYRLRVELGHNTFAGWKTAAELGFPGVSVADLAFSGSLAPGSYNTQDLFDTPDDPNTNWDVQAKLFGRPSDDNGAPQSNGWLELAFGEHVGAVRTISGSALPGGTISGITVSQRRLGRSRR